MRNAHKHIGDFYLTDEYMTKNPSLHEEDSIWKISKIIPLVDKLINCSITKNEINLLDVGGGAGLILNAVSTYMERSYDVKVNKYVLDLSPGMLEIQKKNNPDFSKALNEDIRKTSLGSKVMDITLMIDVLEHVSNPTEVLDELRRISKFVIFKVPLEDNLLAKIWNFLWFGRYRKRLIRTYGHVNVYNLSRLKSHIEKHAGQVLDFCYTGAFDHYLDLERYKGTPKNLVCIIAAYMFRLSPKICSLMFSDFAMIIVKCY